MSTNDRVLFFDTTLRDGEQSPGCTMHHDEKLRFAHQLALLGVDIIEAGFPIASDGDFESVHSIAREVGRDGKSPRIAGLARCKREDIEAVARAVAPAARNRIHTFLASSDLHLEVKLRISRQQALDQTGEMVALAKSHCEDVEFSAEDATRSDIDFLCEMVEIAIQAGATTINLPDTVGYSTPSEYQTMFETVRARVPNSGQVIFSTHCHDDLGLATINTLSGILGGARQVEVSMHGIGERAGNASLEEVAAILSVRKDQYPFTSGIDLKQIGATSKALDQIISFAPSPNKAIVGKNAFAHASGIHQHGVLANPLTYEIMTPASFGVVANTIVLGKHSGRRGLEQKLKELGYNFNREQIDEIYHRFTALADRKKSIYDQDIVALLEAESAPAV
ncbi:2-isopropylmalate synthase [Terriglobus albidus]|uniref:2-isopropylmalate synthase n=1 Tax=Terriglobus albidus TaxID=1592106 RepID=UPI0021E08FB0|nr:2-isopropylmalate synthase [Terriglobus albidus]